ncbi:hypothetical protein HYDPIDRAFT_84776, partial [Hydnomerulius pinastri MD-312]
MADTAQITTAGQSPEIDYASLHAHIAHSDIVDSLSAPHPAEYISVRCALTEDSAKLQLIDNSIEECRRQLARTHAEMCVLERNRSTVQHRLLIHRARLSPLRILPDELLQEIFKRCLPNDRYIVPKINCAPLVLTQICRRWRVVARATSELW